MEQSAATLEAFTAEAARFAGTLAPRTDTATLVTLSGELGAGKTTFVQAVAAAFGIEDPVTSPTFVLEKIYTLPETALFRRLVHIDAYRLSQGADLAALGFDELMQDATTLVLLEWPERVRDGLPVPSARIELETLPDQTRRISYA